MKRLSDRLAGLVVTILLQALFIALFLQTPHLGAPPRELARELTLILPRLVPVPEKPAAPRAVAPPLIQAPRVPDIVSLPPPVTAPPSTANVQGLGKSLFGCAPENLDMLTPQDRARCKLGFVPPDGTAVTAPPSQVKDEAHWVAELALKQSNAIPCTRIETLKTRFDDGGPTGKIYVPMADPMCVLNGIFNGFHADLPP